MPRVRPRPRTTTGQSASSLTEYRARRGERFDNVPSAVRNRQNDELDAGVFDPWAHSFWHYLTARPAVTGNSLDVLDETEQRVLSKATSASGGYLAPQDFADQIVSLRRSGSRIGGVARELLTPNGQTLPVVTATAHGVSTWTAENASFTASDEVFGQVSLGAFKASTLVIVSEELFTDSFPDLDAYLAQELASRQVTLEETAFAVGDGTGKPLGIVAASSGFAVTTAATGSSTGFKLADVIAAYAGLGDAYIPNSTWLMSPSAFRSLAGLVDTAGGLVLPSLHAAQPTLLGRPVVVSGDMPAAAANARSVVFGDLSAAYRAQGLRPGRATNARALLEHRPDRRAALLESGRAPHRPGRGGRPSQQRDMIRRLFRRTAASRRHPTSEQALEALKEGRCLYAPVSTCSGAATIVGLRDDDDGSGVLVCKAHYGRLRTLGSRELDKLERFLIAGFGHQLAPREREDEGPRVIVV
jgi:HK97 family phage major capsid protein